MFRSPTQPCYPEDSQPDGCFPDNARTPSPFDCWLTGKPDRISPAGGTPATPKDSSRPAAAWRLFKPGR